MKLIIHPSYFKKTTIAKHENKIIKLISYTTGLNNGLLSCPIHRKDLMVKMRVNDILN